MFSKNSFYYILNISTQNIYFYYKVNLFILFTNLHAVLYMAMSLKCALSFNLNKWKLTLLLYLMADKADFVLSLPVCYYSLYLFRIYHINKPKSLTLLNEIISQLDFGNLNIRRTNSEIVDLQIFSHTSLLPPYLKFKTETWYDCVAATIRPCWPPKPMSTCITYLSKRIYYAYMF